MWLLLLTAFALIENWPVGSMRNRDLSPVGKAWTRPGDGIRRWRISVHPEPQPHHGYRVMPEISTGDSAPRRKFVRPVTDLLWEVKVKRIPTARMVCCMVAKCSNPSCSAKFLYLKAGRLFCLENDPALRSPESNLVEYFWLCDRCSSTMTLRPGEDGTVVTVLLPKPTRGVQDVPDGVVLTPADGKKGLLLRIVHCSSPEH
jgi:hypothetical protein